ncbi:MAG: hypothetical protein [Caudoviricetes sp.]|nr:MAG: hypothetical protein [Caudoviricetes sp.]
MANENAGGIYYEVGADVADLLTGAKQANDALAGIEKAAGKASDGLKAADDSAKKAGDSIGGAGKEASTAARVIERLGNEVAVLAEQQDKGARSAAVLSAQLAAGEGASQEQVRTIGQLAGKLFDAKQQMDDSAKAALQNAQSMKQAAQEYQRTEGAISSLERNLDLAITEMESGSRAAAVLAAQLQAGAGATQEQRARIELLAGSLYDMKAAQDAASRAASEQAKSAAAQARALAQEASEAAKVRDAARSLRMQIAVLDEEQKNGARSAAMLSARLRAGSSATAAQREEIGELAGKIYDLNQAINESSKANDSASDSGDGLKSTLTAVASAFSVQKIIDWAIAFLEVADTMTQMEARIKRLSPTLEDAKNNFTALASISSQSGSSLSETTRLWENLTASLKDSSATNGQILSLTETLQKIGRVGGSSAEETQSALRQFGQSISSGKIQAEEFNSIIEQTPELARQMAAGLGISTGELRSRMLEGKLSAEDALNAIMSRSSQVDAEFAKLPRTLEQSNNTLQTSFNLLIKQLNEVSGATNVVVRVIDSLSAAIDQLSGKAATANQQMAELTSTGEMYARRAKTWAAIGLDGWAEQAQGVSALSNRAAMLVGDLDAVTKAGKQAANNQPIKIAGSGGDDKEVQKLEKNTKRKLELSRLEGEARARLQAQYDAEDAGIKDSGRIKALQDEYAATERNASAKKTSNAEGKKSETQQEAINNKLAELQQRASLAAGSTAELSRQQVILRAEQSLGEGATKQQIQLAGELAAKAYDTAAALKAQTEADKARMSLQNQFQQIQKTAKPSMAADETYKQQMLAIEQYKMAYPQSIAEAEAARAAIEKQYRDNRTALMWAEWQQQSQAATVFGEALDTSLNTVSSSITGVLNGTQSINEGLANVANTVLSSVVNSFVQMGAEWVKSAIMGQTAQVAAISTTTAASVAGTATTTAASVSSAAATTTAWTPAAIVASIGSFGGAAAIGIGAVIAAMALSSSLAGKRKNGGPVRAGSMYQVGEGGMPEIYQASSGRQYMIPGDNGSVISNKDMMSGSGTSGGGLVVYNNIQNNSSANVSSSAQQNADGSLTISTFIQDMYNGGPMSQSIGSTFNTQRKANE